jgi:hypothetical protein
MDALFTCCCGSMACARSCQLHPWLLLRLATASQAVFNLVTSLLLGVGFPLLHVTTGQTDLCCICCATSFDMTVTYVWYASCRSVGCVYSCRHDVCLLPAQQDLYRCRIMYAHDGS